MRCPSSRFRRGTAKFFPAPDPIAVPDTDASPPLLFSNNIGAGEPPGRGDESDCRPGLRGAGEGVAGGSSARNGLEPDGVPLAGVTAGELLSECPTASCKSALRHRSSSDSTDHKPGLTGTSLSANAAAPTDASTPKALRADAWGPKNALADTGGRSTESVGSIRPSCIGNSSVDGDSSLLRIRLSASATRCLIFKSCST